MGQYDLSVGAFLLGTIVNTYLFGLVTYQFLVYKTTEFNDPLWIKSIVAVLFFLDTLHSVVEVYGAWELCVTNFTNPGILLKAGWVIPLTAGATAICALLAQGFLAHRVLILTKSRILVFAIGIFSVAGCVTGMIACVKSGIIADVTKFKPLTPYVIMWLGNQTAADLLITIALTAAYLRSRTGFRRTDHVLNRLIRGAIQTGLFASIFALGDLFSFLFLNSTYMYVFFAFPMGRIYTNTMLDTLNSRTSIQKQLNSGLDTYPETDATTFCLQSRRSTYRTGTTMTSSQQPSVKKDIPIGGYDEESGEQV
ncbi:hypothetical protein PM082_007306 [Marasmius tenuissimus]|nr:hypothetical protein PM082_007306 [Marasmius tenuissimus]